MKRCRACGIEKDISDFYKLPGTKDGHDSKCIDCVKLSMQQLYKINSQDPQWVEKERERGKEKYHRLGYLDSEWNRRKNDLFWITSEYKGLRRWVSKKIVITDTEEIHHWNYNYIKDFFVLDRRVHAKLHKLIIVDEQNGMFSTKDGGLLDTKDKHLALILNIIKDMGIKKANVGIYNFTK